MTNYDIFILDNIRTIEIIFSVLYVIVVIIGIIIINNNRNKIIKTFKKIDKFFSNHLKVISVEPLPNGASKFYCDDGHIYYAPIGSHITEGNVICKDNFLMIK